MSEGVDDYKYVLILKDDFSSYVWLKATKETTAEVTADYLIEWFSTFGVVNDWVSDRGSHFKNQLIEYLRDKVKSEHHFTLAYCPWSNGTVEVVCRELLRATRALLSEYQLPQTMWHQVLPVVQSVLNNTILDRLGKRCPLTAFTGLPQDTPLLSIKVEKRKKAKVKTIAEVRALQRVQVERMHSSLDKMHKEVFERTTAKRQAAIDSHNRKTNVRPVNFSKGDYVLRGLRESQRGRKPQLRWHGPFVVVECKSEYIFTIKNLLNGDTEDAHGRRLKFFRNKDYKVTEELLNHLAYQDGELLVMESFQCIRQRSGTIELNIKWQGFSSDETDWVSIHTLREDVPDMLSSYLDELRTSGTQFQRKLAASL